MILSDFVLFEQTPEVHTCLKLTTPGTGTTEAESFEVHIIELLKLGNPIPTSVTPKEMWLSFLKGGQNLSYENIKAWGIPALFRAYRMLEQLSLDREFRLECDLRSTLNSNYRVLS